MKTFWKVAVPILSIGAAVTILWPHVDRNATQVSLCVTGFGLALAWYSIFDLQEQRRERFWPHTLDRLMRATFTAVTLVFVADLAVRPAPPLPPPPVQQPPPTPRPTFGEAVIELVRRDHWTEVRLAEVVDEHFKGLRGVAQTNVLAMVPSRVLPLMVDEKHKFVLRADNDQVKVSLVP